jgi:hypothetical protein
VTYPLSPSTQALLAVIEPAKDPGGLFIPAPQTPRVQTDSGWDAERAAKARAELRASISSSTKAVLAGIRNNWNAPNEVVAAKAFRSFVSSLDPEEPITPDQLFRIADELDP